MIDPLTPFERLVVEALDDLPDVFLRALDNVEIVVEPEPTVPQKASVGVVHGALFGLYQGVPRTARTSSYGMVLPDKITIFEGPIRRYTRSDGEMRRVVRRTVVHELAHHFGISDERLRELGAY